MSPHVGLSMLQPHGWYQSAPTITVCTLLGKCGPVALQIVSNHLTGTRPLYFLPHILFLGQTASPYFPFWLRDQKIWSILLRRTIDYFSLFGLLISSSSFCYPWDMRHTAQALHLASASMCFVLVNRSPSHIYEHRENDRVHYYCVS